MKNFKVYRRRYKITANDTRNFIIMLVFAFFSALALWFFMGGKFMLDNAVFIFLCFVMAFYYLDFKKQYIDFKRKRVYRKRQIREMEKDNLSDILVFWNGDKRDAVSNFVAEEGFQFSTEDIFDPIYELKKVAKLKGYKAVISLTKLKDRVEGYFGNKRS